MPREGEIKKNGKQLRAGKVGKTRRGETGIRESP